MKKGKSTGSEYAGTLGSASHRFEVFYCLLLGNASAVVVLPSRHVKYTVSIYKKKEKACGLLFLGGEVGGWVRRLLQSRKRYMISPQHAGLMA